MRQLVVLRLTCSRPSPHASGHVPSNSGLGCLACFGRATILTGRSACEPSERGNAEEACDETRDCKKDRNGLRRISRARVLRIEIDSDKPRDEPTCVGNKGGEQEAPDGAKSGIPANVGTPEAEGRAEEAKAACEDVLRECGSHVTSLEQPTSYGLSGVAGGTPGRAQRSSPIYSRPRPLARGHVRSNSGLGCGQGRQEAKLESDETRRRSLGL